MSLKALIAFLSLATFASGASAVAIDSFDNGWYRSDGIHLFSTDTVTGTFIGPAGNRQEFRSFYAFDLAGVSVTSVTDASIKFFAGNGTNTGDDLSKQLGIFDYSGQINVLLNGLAGLTGFNDLGSGISYGATTVSKTTSSTMPEIVIDLSASAVSALNSALSSTDKRFVAGASLTESYTSTQELWNSSGLGLLPAAALVINENGGNIPIPSTLALLALGLFATGYQRRRGKGQD